MLNKEFILKQLAILMFIVSLSGCFGPATFDASSQASIEESTQKLSETLTPEQSEEFEKALLYFTIGGADGFKAMMGAAFSGNTSSVPSEEVLTNNLKIIDGLTSEQILEKYRTRLEQDRVQREIDEAEREKEKAEREKVSSLKQEAKKLLNSNKFQEALSTYKALSELTAGVDAAEQGISETTKAMEDFAEKMAYLEKVEITEFVAKRISTYSKKETPAVRISLKNTGDRSLDRVKVVVYFNDKNGKTIFEEDYYPVNVRSISLSGNNKPLKPGYVKEMDKDRYYTIDSPLSDWEDGNAVAKVVDLDFTE